MSFADIFELIKVCGPAIAVFVGVKTDLAVAVAKADMALAAIKEINTHLLNKKD